MSKRKYTIRDNAPKWATWIAMDTDGTIWMYEHRPIWNDNKKMYLPNEGKNEGKFEILYVFVFLKLSIAQAKKSLEHLL